MNASQRDENNLEKQIANFRKLAWLFVLLGVAAALYGFLTIHWDTDAQTSYLSKLGNLGSYFQGAVGSLWALAGLFFIYIAFLGQRLQLVKQDNELIAQQAQFELQHKSIMLQNFENSFYAMLNLLQGIVSQTEDNVEYRTQGRGCFKKMRNRFVERINDENRHRLSVENLTPSTGKPLNEAQNLEKQFCISKSIYEKFFNDHIEQLV